MLRTLTWSQFLEIMALYELEPLGLDRIDLLFALLASVVAGSAGAKGVDGKDYTPANFLRGLRPADDAVSIPVRKQTVEQMEAHLTGWIMASNQVFKESTAAGRRR
jgi:hypothetical protein